MITRRRALGVFAAAVFSPALVVRARAATATDAWISLFNGRSLDGWKPSAKSPHSRASKNTTAGNWRVSDGIILGSQDTPANGGLLLTTAEFGDVEVALEMKNDFGIDSGIFLRCTEDGRAYQCLIDYYEGGTIGGVLGERIWKVRGVRNYSFGAAPGIITLNDNPQRCSILPESWPHFWRAGQWNEIRTRIVGDPPTITTWVNGVQILQHVEPASVHPSRGHIGLQVHGGPKSKGTVRYRNIRARAL